MPILEAAVAFPTGTSLRRFIPSNRNTAAVATSPFTGVQQVQEWPGGDFWMVKGEWPPMKRPQAAEIIAFLASLRGPVRRFMLGPSDAKTPRGVALGTPLVGPMAVANSFVLPTKGWTPNTPSVLLAGDYLAIDNHLHMITEPEDASGSGNAAFAVWPSLRSAYAEDLPITLVNPQGMFRLTKTDNELYDADAGKIYNISFEAIEAR